MLKNILTSVGIVTLIVISFIIGRKSINAPEQKARVDTIVVEKPVEREVKVTERVEVPVYVSVTSTPDTVFVVQHDTVFVKVSVDIEQRVYGDSTFRAVVSGPAIANLHPSLDEYEVYARTETKYIEKKTPFVIPYISISGGQQLIGGGFGLVFKQKVSVGARYLHIDRKGHFAFEAGWQF